MLDSQPTETEAEMNDSELVTVFAAWIERVTRPPAAADLQPRHRAEPNAG